MCLSVCMHAVFAAATSNFVLNLFHFCFRFFAGGETGVKNLLTQKLQKMEQALFRTSADEPEAVEAERAAKVTCMEAGPSTGSPCTSTNKSSFSSLYSRILGEYDVTRQGLSKCRYMKEPTMSEKDSPFQYWANNHARFPHLAAIAVKFLSAPSMNYFQHRR